MTNLYHLYIDDSGTRHPDRKPGKKPAHGHDYFALGGLLIKKEDENSARENHKLFCERWGIVEPLHSSEIRAQSNNFSFIGKLETPQKDIFYEELYNLMKDIPVLGIACVIDRPGYNDRYLARYGRQRWDLCKTAFSICVERAAKFAALNNSRLKVFPERSDPSSDKKLKEYYDSLRKDGLPFDPGNSDKYTPLKSTDLHTTLCEFKTKHKSSPMAQFADLYLWPICMGGYDPDNRPYKRLIQDGKLINCVISAEQKEKMGIKYSCWELAEKTKAR